MITSKNNWSMLKKIILAKAVQGNNSGTLVEETATGNPAVFQTNVKKALTKFDIPFTPAQAGSGDQSPSNPRAISGLTGILISISGEDTSNPETIGVIFPAEAGTVYGGKLDAVTGMLKVEWTLIDLSEVAWKYSSPQQRFYKDGFNNIVLPADQSSNPEILCNLYLPTIWRNLATSTIKDTIIGGIVSSGSYNLSIRDKEFTDPALFKKYLSDNNAVMSAKLVTPVTYQLSPVVIETIIGTNTIWSDTNGQNTIKYQKKT